MYVLQIYLSRIAYHILHIFSVFEPPKKVAIIFKIT